MFKAKRLQLFKYSILKPNSQINTLKTTFKKPHNRCMYQLATSDSLFIRKYKRRAESLQTLIQDYQWRLQKQCSIVSCYYIQIQSPSSGSKFINIDVYIQDLEITISNMKKILFPQAIYLLIQSINGYKLILQKFGNVSIDEYTIGLNCLGECKVWINSSLQKNECDLLSFNNPKQIIIEILKIIKIKCQRVCQGIIQKLLNYFYQNKISNFIQGIQIIQKFYKSFDVQIPSNLKYLVLQQRYSNKINHNKLNRNYLSSRASLTSDQYQNKNYFQHPSLESNTLKKNSSIDGNITTWRSVNSNHRMNTSIKSCNPPLKISNNTESYKSNYQHIFHTRVKSQSNQCHNIIVNIKNKSIEGTISTKEISDRKTSGVSENIQTKTKLSSSTDNVKYSEIKGFSPSNDVVKKTPHLQKSLYDSKQCESYQCSPFIVKEVQKINGIPQSVLEDVSDAKFDSIPQFFKANNWRATLKTLSGAKIDLNASIADGQDINSYLSDIKLSKLEKMSKTMVVSLIPDKHSKYVIPIINGDFSVANL